MRNFHPFVVLLALVAASTTPSIAQTTGKTEDFENWPILKSTFPSTGGVGILIKGYDPVLTNGKCVTTFMAIESGDNPVVYPSFVEFDAVPTSGGTLCTNGKWRAFDGGPFGTTPYRVFFKNGVFRGSP